MKKIVIIVSMFIMLTGCGGPTLFTIGGFKITAGSVVTMPIKKEIIKEITGEKDKAKEEVVTEQLED